MSTDGNTLTPQNAGYYEGVTDVYYALMLNAGSGVLKPTYGAVKALGKSIELQVTPNYRERKVYASNAATRREQLPESYSVSLNLDQVIPEVRTEVLGRREGGDGVELITGKNVGPWLAIMFAATLDDGSQEYRTLYRGRFSEPTGTHHTKNDGDSYQHPTIQATFVPVAYHELLSAILQDEGKAAGRNLIASSDIVAAGEAGNTDNVTIVVGTLTDYFYSHPAAAMRLSYDWELTVLSGEASGSWGAGLSLSFMGEKADGTPGTAIGAGSISIGNTKMSGHGSYSVSLANAQAVHALSNARLICNGKLVVSGMVLQLSISNVKLETGSTETDYTPAPEGMIRYVYVPDQQDQSEE